MKIIIRSVPHENHRYPTVGDYYEQDGTEVFEVSDMGNPTYELAVALHEMIEWHLCGLMGVDMKSIDDFDISYEDSRSKGVAPCGCPIQDEPGNDIHAPYHLEHVFATKLEQQFMDEASWIKYDRAVENL